jgi:hypothetical protein
MRKKPSKQKFNEKKEWTVVVYMWAFGFADLDYLIGETVFRTTQPHPIHWMVALIGGISGVGTGWLWYRWRGDVL